MQGNPTPTPASIGAQPQSSALDAFLALATTGTVSRDGAEAFSTYPVSPFSKDALALADAGAWRAALGVASTNRLINGGMAVDQVNEGAAQTITAGAALAYTVDRWYAYAVGANVTGQRVQGATAGRFRYQFTGAASVTAIGFGQRIEQLNCADLAGQTATLSVDLANSLLTSVTWTAYYATTKDTFGTLASPTRTQIATGAFTVSSTVARYSTQIDIPIEATTGIEIVFSVGAQTSGTWVIGDVQLEKGSAATPFENRFYPFELLLCKSYLQLIGGTATAGDQYLMTGMCNTTLQARFVYPYPVEMRAIPSVSFPAASNFLVYAGSVAPTATVIAQVGVADPRWLSLFATVASGLVTGNAVILLGTGTASIKVSAEL